MMANATTYNTKNYQPPGEWLQKLNALLHKEPFASLAYAVYWSFMLITVTPAATVFLHAQAAYRILAWLLGWTGQDEYLPSSFKNINNKDDGSSMPELGVVITGCDSGFGKELALWADHAGFHVFAGCLFEASFVAFDETNNITPILMDVTKDEHVNAAVKRVEKWIAAVADNGKKRALHALCNNAGIVKLTWIDWMEMKDIQLIMEGTRQKKKILVANALSVIFLYLSCCCYCIKNSQLFWNGTLLQSLSPLVEKTSQRRHARGSLSYFEHCQCRRKGYRTRCTDGVRGIETCRRGLFQWPPRRLGQFWDSSLHDLSNVSWNTNDH